MAWKASCVMDERAAFVLRCRRGQEPMARLCDEFGISRKTGYKWLGRYESEGPAGLHDRSRAPHHMPHAFKEDVVEAILERRGKVSHEGPHKIRAYLKRAYPDLPCPSPSTIAEILRAHGKVKKRRRRPLPDGTRPAMPMSEYTQANDAWCADFKGWFRTGNGAKCTPLTITDASSRFLLRCQGMGAGLGYEEVRPLFEITFREYGLPNVIRTDNGPPFGSTGLGGLSVLSIWFLQLGVRPEHIRPGKPQDNGRHERMHRTLREATADPPQHTLRTQQRAFDGFVEYYNFERPHQALGQRPPAEFYQPSERPYPTRLLQPEYPREWTVRKVKLKGGMMWGGRECFLSQVLAGQYVGLEPIDNDCWLIHYMHLPLAVFDEPAFVIRPYRPATDGQDD